MNLHNNNPGTINTSLTITSKKWIKEYSAPTLPPGIGTKQDAVYIKQPKIIEKTKRYIEDKDYNYDLVNNPAPIAPSQDSPEHVW